MKAKKHDYEAGLAVISPEKIQDPGLEPHRVRMTDKSVKHEQSANRQVAALFLLSAFGSVFSIYAYFAFPITEDLATVRANNLWLGI